MEKIFGDKSVFAVQIDILKFKPWIWGKTAIWIKGDCFGNYNEQNILGPFFGALHDISFRSEDLWEEEFDKLDCKQIFYKINPFYNNQDDFYDLTYEEQGEYVKYDKYIIQWGENFYAYLIKVIIKEDVCKFVYVGTSFTENDTYEVRNNIKCFDVPLSLIKEVYKQMCDLIPDKYWYSKIEKGR